MKLIGFKYIKEDPRRCFMELQSIAAKRVKVLFHTKNFKVKMYLDLFTETWIFQD